MTESNLYGLQWGSQTDIKLNNMELEKSYQNDRLSTSILRFVIFKLKKLIIHIYRSIL
jgi:hypothetical protein